MKYIENIKNCLFFIQFKGFQVLLTYWFVFQEYPQSYPQILWITFT
jgi:hypothetical protein